MSRMMRQAFHVIFVCTGNICRSPTAHGVFRQRVRDAGLDAQVRVDSAGTQGYHVGDPPDARSQAHARTRGYELADLRARQLAAVDFAQADLLLVMDEDNLRVAQARCPAEHRARLHRFTEFCRVHRSRDVPDPYYGGADGFERVLDLVEDGCDGLLAHVREALVERRS
jgi:protein-tyrosine phosphatase